MTEVFKTNITDETSAEEVLSSLVARFPHTRFTLDLDDCDKVLRAENMAAPVSDLSEFISSMGFECEVLEG